MFSSILHSESAFFGRGNITGPQVVMTDNCSELRDALKYVWPKSVLLFCSFHILQQIWRWLFDKKHNISDHDRSITMTKFKNSLYEKSFECFEQSFEEFRSSDLVTKYPGLVSYINGLYEMNEHWAHCYRTHLVIRGNNTNNPVEAQFLVLKDTILERKKEINVNGLFEKLANDFDQHYKVKLLNVASGSFDGIYPKKKQLRNLPSASKISEISRNVEKTGPSSCKCPSFNDTGCNGDEGYTVNTDIGVCSCPVGKDGSSCKHQYVIWTTIDCSSYNYVPYLSAEERQKFAQIAIGETLPKEFYAGVHGDYSKAGVCESALQSDDSEDPVIGKDTVDCQSVGHSRSYIDVTTTDECKIKIQKVAEYLMAKG